MRLEVEYLGGFYMDFKNIPKKYRPIPFWSWNEKLETEQTKEQNAGQKSHSKIY